MKDILGVGSECIIISEQGDILDALIIAKFNEDLFGLFDTDRRFHQIKPCNIFSKREDAEEVLKHGSSNK